MKKVFLVLVFALLCLNNIQAARVKGYYISTTNDTVSVTFKRSLGTVFTRNSHYKLKYYDSNNQKKKLTPDMAIEVGYEYKGKVYRMLSRNRAYLPSAVRNEGQIFLQLIMDGYLKLFNYEPDVYLLQIGDEEMYWAPPFYQKKSMVDYVSDCPDLVKKLENGICALWRLEQIVKYYNDNCGLEEK